MNEKENIEKWIEFLEPNNLKENLLSASLFIAVFESFKDYVIDEVKFFYNTGFSDGKYTFDDKYNSDVKSLDKSLIKSSLIWLRNNSVIDDVEIELYDELIQYRNKLSHELMSLLFEGLPEELPIKYNQLIELRIKIEKWWILNVDIPASADDNLSSDIDESDIITSSQMLNQLIIDMLSGDEKKATFYQNEFKKYNNK